MTPEEIQQVAQLRAMALRGQQPQPQAMTQDADVLSGIGGALAGWGGKSGAAVSENATKQGDALRQLAQRQQQQNLDVTRVANAEKHAGVEDLLRQQQITKLKQDLAESGAQASPIYGDMATSFGLTLPPGMTNEQARKALEIGERAYGARLQAQAAKDRAAKERESKPIPEQEAVKINNQLEGLGAIDHLTKLQSDISPAGAILGQIGDTNLNKYRDAVEANAGSIAAAQIPGGRENVPLIEEIKRSLPGGATNKERAAANFAERRANILSNAKSQIASLKAAGYSPAQIADYESKVAAAEARGGAPASGGGGRQAVKDKSGKLLGYINADGTEELVR